MTLSRAVPEAIFRSPCKAEVVACEESTTRGYPGRGDPSPGRVRPPNCVFFLDHFTNEASTAVFVEALNDPVDFVRNAALHSIACESCRTDELCVTDVVPNVAGVLEGDPSPELRTKAILILLRLAGRDSRAWEAIRRAAEHDPDGIVRQAAADALRGHFVAPRKRYERRQRRYDRTAARTAR